MSVIVPARGERDIDKIGEATRQIAQGRVNCTGTVTLAAGVTTTVVSAPTVAPGTIILLSHPQTANAAGALATTYILAANVIKGQFTLTHANAGTTDRTFGWAAFG